MHTGLEVSLIVALNLFSVIGIVTVNKHVYRSGFAFPTTLMVLHFFCTWLFVVALQRAGGFQAKKINEWHRYAILGACQVGSVAFVNLSLLFNTVGTYQLFKFCNVFMTVLIEFFWINKIYSVSVYVCLCCLVCGVSIATITQVEFSAMGVVTGLLGSVSTAVYQIYNKRVQTENEVSALQLLQYEQPFTVAWAAVFACFSDNLPQLADVRMTQSLAGSIFLSCVCAFGVNVSCYLIIGKTSPLTYSVVGHVKTIGVLLVGFVVFHEVTTANQMLGMLIAFGAIVWYTHATTMGSRPSDKKTDDVAMQSRHDSGDDVGAENEPIVGGGGSCASLDKGLDEPRGDSGAGSPTAHTAVGMSRKQRALSS